MININRNFIVYKISNTINNMVYIGVTSSSLKNRFSVHKSSAKRGCKTKLCLDINLYGSDKFSIEQIDTINASAVMYANNLEFKYIKKYNSIYPNGYNTFGFADRKKYHKQPLGTNK